MAKNNILIKFSGLIIVLSFIYLGIQIYRIIMYIDQWVRLSHLSLFNLIFGVIKEIGEILYYPLWGFTISFSLLFFNKWKKNKNI